MQIVFKESHPPVTILALANLSGTGFLAFFSLEERDDIWRTLGVGEG